MACGDINDVALDESGLTVRVKDSMMQDLLSDGKREIENALRWQGLDIGFNVEKKQEKISPQDEDIEKLTKLVGDYLSVK